MTGLTPRQQRVLAYCRLFQRNYGRFPHVREIGAHFGWRSSNSGMDVLRVLVRKGVLEYVAQTRNHGEYRLPRNRVCPTCGQVAP